MGLLLWVRVDLEVMAVKEFFTLLRAPELERHYQFNVIPRINLLLGELTPLQGI